VPRVLLTFEPPDGGVARNVVQLALGLARHGWEAEVAGPADALPSAALEAAGVPVHPLPFGRGYRRPHREAAALAELRRLLAARDYELVHGHAAKAGALARLAARAAGVPALYSPHCFPFAMDVPALARRGLVVAERALAAFGGDVLCVCEAERRLALGERIAPGERLHVVHNGSEPHPEDVEADPRLRALAAAAGPLVGAVSVLRRQKRLDVLLDAAPLILAAVPDARIAIVGDGPLRDELRAHAARRGLDGDERVALLPFSPPAARHLAALDVHVLPSAWEAFPIGVLEALASGVPQVATDVGGTREAITPATGILVAPGDPRALAEAVIALLRDPARRAAMATAARARHAEAFGVARMVAGTAAVYERVIAA
jgi:glycosyltransferase involved in cell wall biosynthesis